MCGSSTTRRAAHSPWTSIQRWWRRWTGDDERGADDEPTRSSVRPVASPSDLVDGGRAVGAPIRARRRGSDDRPGAGDASAGALRLPDGNWRDLAVVGQDSPGGLYLVGRSRRCSLWAFAFASSSYSWRVRKRLRTRSTTSS